VVEGEGFDEFLDGAAELALVAPAVEAGDVGDDVLEEGGDLVEAGFGLFGDWGGDGGFYCADAGRSLMVFTMILT
jgi:hypothetical protein